MNPVKAEVATDSRTVEQAVLGALLVAPEHLAGVRQIMQPPDFYTERNRWVYEAMIALDERNALIDQATVAAQLTEHDHLDDVGGEPYLYKLAIDVPNSAYATSYAQEVQRAAEQRRNREDIEPLALDAILAALERGETGDAELLARLYETRLVHDHTRHKWFLWNGRHWIEDHCDSVINLVNGPVVDRYLYAAAELRQTGGQGNDKSVAALFKRAAALYDERRIQHVLRLARSQPALAITGDEWDDQPWLLGVENGTIDLTAGEPKQDFPLDYIGKVAGTRWEGPDATCPLWLAFLDRIMAGNEKMISFLRRAVGYSLTGSTREHVLFILYGTGANGKTVFLETIRAMLGDHAMRTPTETLMLKRAGAIPNDVARLRGARFVSANESEIGRRLAEALVKDLTGGDTLSARFMRGEWFDFKPTSKLWFATNHRPQIRGTDKAIWRRIRLVPFEVSIPENEQDKDLAGKLKAELSGILAWAVRGCLEWQRDGLGIPFEVEVATEQYRNEQDTIGAFLDECCILADGLTVTVKSLYEAYKAWCETSGEKAASKRQLSLLLQERDGILPSRTSKARIWYGVGLLDTDHEQVME